jgi:hypothetical protein
MDIGAKYIKNIPSKYPKGEKQIRAKRSHYVFRIDKDVDAI